MKASDFKSKTVEALQAELLSLTQAQFSLRMQVATQQLTNTSEFRKVRRDVARIKTILTQKGAQQ
ncbi:MAG: 50S ribosomal protein L29 [Gallionella sp.]|nr:50S ribosomal protein L29 [Gallionella sp.]